MIFKEFRNKSKPVIIFLHGGGLSWWSLKPQIEALQKDYFIVYGQFTNDKRVSSQYYEE